MHLPLFYFAHFPAFFGPLQRYDGGGALKLFSLFRQGIALKVTVVIGVMRLMLLKDSPSYPPITGPPVFSLTHGMTWWFWNFFQCFELQRVLSLSLSPQQKATHFHDRAAARSTPHCVHFPPSRQGGFHPQTLWNDVRFRRSPRTLNYITRSYKLKSQWRKHLQEKYKFLPTFWVIRITLLKLRAKYYTKPLAHKV